MFQTSWKPDVAQVYNITQCYSRRLPARGKKSRFQLKCQVKLQKIQKYMSLCDPREFQAKGSLKKIQTFGSVFQPATANILIYNERSVIYIINKTFVYLNMLTIAGQTAGPYGLHSFVDTHVFIGLKIEMFFLQNIFLTFFFHGQRRALQIV